MERQQKEFTISHEVFEDGWPFLLETTNRFEGKIQTLWINPEGQTWMHRTHRTILGAKRFHTKAFWLMTLWGSTKCATMEERKIRSQKQRKLWGDENYLK